MAPNPLPSTTKLNSPSPLPGWPQLSRNFPELSMIQKAASNIAVDQILPSGASVTQHAPASPLFLPPPCQSCFRAGSTGRLPGTTIGDGTTVGDSASATADAVGDRADGKERAIVAPGAADASPRMDGLAEAQPPSATIDAMTSAARTRWCLLISEPRLAVLEGAAGTMPPEQAR